MKILPPLDDTVWLTEGFIVGARAEHDHKIHAGVVHPLEGSSRRLYTMSPLCPRYRKRNGEQLARHARGHSPMLVGSTRRAFGDYVTGRAPHGLPLCTYCVHVWRADHEAEYRAREAA